jgi:hypothetical protein
MIEAGQPKFRGPRGSSALFVPAGLFLGVGTGWAFGSMVSGLLVGLVAGLLVFAMIAVAKHD